MDYKKIIKSRKLRLAILRFLSFIPDKMMLKFQYYVKMGRRLNLKKPQRFTEKMQYYKLYYRNQEMIRCVDKFDVRSYVEELNLGFILNECYGVYDSPDEIDYYSLPDRFVLKDTLGGGGNSIIIINDKNNMEVEHINSQLNNWVNKPHRTKGGGREWPYYSGKKHRILIEALIESDEKTGGLIDYKFFCFNGHCEFLYVMGNRSVGESVNVSIFDRNFQKLQVQRVGDDPFEGVEKPENYEEMLVYAEKLSQGFPHVRVDLYNQDGKIIFGELAFFNASGYMKYEPDTFDIEVGKKWLKM